jgi:ribosomal protein S21
VYANFIIFNHREEVNHVSELKRKKNETFEAFMRRVKQQWQRSGKIFQARKIQYFDPKKSKNVQRKQAVKYAHKVEKTNFLRKTGKLPAEKNTFQNRRRKK